MLFSPEFAPQGDTNDVPDYSGMSFESMHETLTKVASVEVSQIGSIDGFEWAARARSNGNTTLKSIACNREWQLSTTANTPEWLTILVPRLGVCGMSRGKIRMTALPGQLLVVNNYEVENFLILGPRHQSDNLHLNWSTIVEAVGELLEMPVTGSLELSSVIDRTTSSGRLITNMVETIIAGMRDNELLLHSPIALASLARALVHSIVHFLPHRFSMQLERRTFTPSPWHVRRAIDFMHANMSKPITISVVAYATNVSVRTLENGFRAFKNTTPASYLRMMRLQAARKDLLDPSNKQSINTICQKWGVVHVGRFSAMYRSVYGENPSQTRRQGTPPEF